MLDNTLANMAIAQAQEQRQQQQQQQLQQQSLQNQMRGTAEEQIAMKKLYSPDNLGEYGKWQAPAQRPMKMINGEQYGWTPGSNLESGSRGGWRAPQWSGNGQWAKPTQEGLGDKLFKAGVLGVIGGGVGAAGAAALGGAGGGAAIGNGFGGGLGTGNAGYAAAMNGSGGGILGSLGKTLGDTGTKMKDYWNSLSKLEQGSAALTAPALIPAQTSPYEEDPEVRAYPNGVNQRYRASPQLIKGL